MTAYTKHENENLVQIRPKMYLDPYLFEASSKDEKDSPIMCLIEES